MAAAPPNAAAPASTATSATNNQAAQDLPPPATNSVPAAKKGKGKKTNEPADTAKLVADALARMEQGNAVDRAQDKEIEREVKKANREMQSILNSLPDSMAKIDALQKKTTELLTELKKTQRTLAAEKKKSEIMTKERNEQKERADRSEKQNLAAQRLSRTLGEDKKKLEVKSIQIAIRLVRN